MDIIGSEAEGDNWDDDNSFISSDDDNNSLMIMPRIYEKAFVDVMLFRILR